MTTGINLCVILSIFHISNTYSYIMWTPPSACSTARAINQDLEDRYVVGREHFAHYNTLKWFLFYLLIETSVEPRYQILQD